MDIRVGKTKSHRERKNRAGREQWEKRKAERNILKNKKFVWTNLGKVTDIKDGETVCEHGNRPFDCKTCRPI